MTSVGFCVTKGTTLGTLGDFFLQGDTPSSAWAHKGLDGFQRLLSKNTQQRHFFYSWIDISVPSHIYYLPGDLS